LTVLSQQLTKRIYNFFNNLKRNFSEFCNLFATFLQPFVFWWDLVVCSGGVGFDDFWVFCGKDFVLSVFVHVSVAEATAIHFFFEKGMS